MKWYSRIKKSGRAVAYMRSKLPPGEAQLNHQARFREAAAYAKRALADQNLRYEYEIVAEQMNKPAPSLCVRDFLKPPTIQEIDLSDYNREAGSTIKLIASDDFGVVSVNVVITDQASGTVIENGPAVESIEGTNQWIYTVTRALPSGTTGWQLQQVPELSKLTPHHTA
jgi:hypothetical protein